MEQPAKDLDPVLVWVAAAFDAVCDRPSLIGPAPVVVGSADEEQVLVPILNEKLHLESSFSVSPQQFDTVIG
jgi:hypothetical protein